MAFTLPISDIISVYKEVIDEVTNTIGAICEVHYPPTKTDCTNCIFVSFGNSGASNTYNGTGPHPFSFGNCPLCEGAGYREVLADTDTIRLRFYPNRKDWKKAGPVSMDDCDAMIIGFVADMPKLLRCQKILIDTEISNIKNQYFALAGDLYTYGFGDLYFIGYVKRTTS